MAQTNPPFMSGVPELLVLRPLARQEMYGYEIVRAVKLATGQAISLGEGVIYPVLHSLEKTGALRAKRKAVNGRTRVYYSLTSKGRSRFDRLASEWDRVSGGIDSALSDREHANA